MAIPTPPVQLTSQENEAVRAELQELMYDYTEDMLAIQRCLREAWTQYVTKTTTLRTVHGVLYNTMPLMEGLSAELYESAPDFDARSQGD